MEYFGMDERGVRIVFDEANGRVLLIVEDEQEEDDDDEENEDLEADEEYGE